MNGVVFSCVIGFVAVGTEALRKGIEGLFLVMEAVEVGSRE